MMTFCVRVCACVCVRVLAPVVAMLGMLSPSSRGALMTTACFLFMFMGCVPSWSLCSSQSGGALSWVGGALSGRSPELTLRFVSMQGVWWLLCRPAVPHTERTPVEERSLLRKWRSEGLRWFHFYFISILIFIIYFYCICYCRLSVIAFIIYIILSSPCFRCRLPLCILRWFLESASFSIVSSGVNIPPAL